MISLALPFLPPSSNVAYFNLPGRGRSLSNDGKKFLRAAKTHFTRNYPKELTVFVPNHPYALFVKFYFEELENVGFASGKARNRYKKFDGGNRMKLLEDALFDAGGIDDSQVLYSGWAKLRAESPALQVAVWDMSLEANPFRGQFIE